MLCPIQYLNNFLMVITGYTSFNIQFEKNKEISVLIFQVRNYVG